MVEIFQNIRKIYTFREPCEELAPHIEFFSETALEQAAMLLGGQFFSVKMFASFTPTFYINLGPSYHITIGNRRHFIPAQEDILILRDTIVERHNLPTDNIFTVKFNPGGLQAVLGINQTSYKTSIVNLGSLLPVNVLKAIKQPISFDERVELMQQYLVSCIKTSNHNGYYNNLVNDAIGEYNSTGMQLNTGKVAEKIFVTSKTINRYFNRVVGISPKGYFSIIRARTALTAFVNNEAMFVPYDHGYYDMSHFYKDVVKFTGQTLKQQRV